MKLRSKLVAKKNTPKTRPKKLVACAALDSLPSIVVITPRYTVRVGSATVRVQAALVACIEIAEPIIVSSSPNVRVTTAEECAQLEDQKAIRASLDN